MSWKSENPALISSYLESPEKRLALPFVHSRLEIAPHRRAHAAERARGAAGLSLRIPPWRLKTRDLGASPTPNPAPGGFKILGRLPSKSSLV